MNGNTKDQRFCDHGWFRAWNIHHPGKFARCGDCMAELCDHRVAVRNNETFKLTKKFYKSDPETLVYYLYCPQCSDPIQPRGWEAHLSEDKLPRNR
jgi:hypothetical protein